MASYRAILTASLVLAAGCADLRQRTENFDVSDQVTGLDVSTIDGNVTIKVGGEDKIVVSAQVRGPPTRIDESIEGGELFISLDCPAACGADFDIEIPARRFDRVAAKTTGGNISLEDFEATAIDAQTDGGNIDLEVVVASQATVTSKAGNIDSREITVDVLRATIESGGSVDANFIARPQEAVVSTPAGNLNVRVPTGSYRVVAQSDAGETSVENITRDDQSARTIDARTGAGNVSIVGE